MPTLNELVLGLKESQELAAKGIFKVGETVFIWVAISCGYILNKTQEYHSDGSGDIPAPTLTEMVLKVAEIQSIHPILAMRHIVDFAWGKPIETAELAAFALLMVKVNP